MVLANRICKHALCEVGLVGATGIPTHVPVAAVLQLAEYEQMVTTIVSRNKIELNFKDPWPEAEELTADRAVAHILAKENTAWTWAAGRGQVRLKAQRRSATTPSADERARKHRTRWLLKLARQVEDLVRQLHRHVGQVGGLGVAPWNMLRLKGC